MTLKNLSFASGSAPALEGSYVSDFHYPSSLNDKQISGTHPRISSGCEKKSVILSRSDLGSRTKVGKAILLRSMPGLTTPH
jgi:hypothetical protein